MGHSTNMYSSGQELYSYALRIGFTDADGNKVAEDHTQGGGCFHSMTTSGKHVNEAKAVAYPHVVRPDRDVWGSEPDWTGLRRRSVR
tara:strand:- start:534 stop:794 length:261 start_codon:yes stop_codon:yes gene_type:complete